MSESVQLTQTVQKGGCAAKIAATELRAILAQVRFPAKDHNVLIDGANFDDAGIYQVSNEIALVQTLDFFTPIVDSPKLFGAVAAANALSDVYAMGGEPKTAMAILAFPLGTLRQSVIADVLQGACDQLQEVGVNLLGGHSIDDETLKFGLSVTGYVHPQKIWSNAGAKAGDHLILTKALGTGTCMAALKRQAKSEEQLAEAIRSMLLLNRTQDLWEKDNASFVHAATDITGFGLLGHSQQMAKASRVRMRFHGPKIPLFALTRECLQNGFLTKAHRSNSEYTSGQVQNHWQDPLGQLALVDPQTSGGLLLSVDANKAQDVLQDLRKRFAQAEIIGEALASDPQKPLIEVTE